MLICPKCTCETFELESVRVQNAPTELFAVKCSNCNTVITMFPPYWNTTTGSVLSQLDYASELFRRKKK